MPMKYVKNQSLPRMDDPVLNRALEQLDEELNKIARVFIDWTDTTQDFKTTGTMALNPGFTGTGKVINITPSAALDTEDAEWDGINIDGALLDPSVIGTYIHGVHVDFGGIDMTYDPHIDGIHVQMPYFLNGSHAIHAEGEIHVNIDTSTAVASMSYTAIDVVIDTIGSGGGMLHALDVARVTGGDLSTVALGTHTGIDVIHQHIGTATAFDAVLKYDGSYSDVTAACGSAGTPEVPDVTLWDAQGDIVYFGHATVFDEIECIWATPATKDMHFTFWYSTGTSTYTEFDPADDTRGGQTNGIIRFLASDIGSWATDTVDSTAGKYWIKIIRTRLAGTAPIEDTVKYIKGTTYEWDKLGDVSIRNLGIGISTWGDSAVKVLGIGGSTAPTTSPANMVQMWSEDIMADHAQLHYRAEGGIARPLDRMFDVRDYGASNSESAANNRQYLQDAIDAAPVGGTVIIPRLAGAYLIDNAIPLEITDALTLIFRGEVELVRHDSDFCNVTGDNVTIIGEGGRIVGNGIFVQNGAIACAIFHVTGDRFTCRDLTLEDPTQCGIFLDGSADDIIFGVRIVGGTELGSGSGTQNYGIEIEGATTTGIMISNVIIVPNIAGGVMVEGIAGGTAAGLGHITVTGCYFEGIHDHACYLFGDHNTITGNTANGTSGNPFKFVGKYLTITGNTVSGNTGGGIEARNTKGTTITGNVILNFTSNAIEVSEYGDYESSPGVPDSFDNIIIANNTVRGKASGTVSSGIRLATSDCLCSNVQIVNNNIYNANNVSAQGYHAIFVSCDEGKTINRLKIDGNIIDTTGEHGIAIVRVEDGTISNNLVRDPAQLAANNQGIHLGASCDNIYIFNNQIIKETGGNAMDYGIFVTVGCANCILESNKITGDGTEEVSVATDEGHQFFMTDSSGHVGINRPVPNSGELLEVGGNIAAGFSDTGKIALHNAAGTERAFLQLATTVLRINADSYIEIKPNNTLAATFLAAGQLELVNDLWMANDRPLRFRNFADNDNLICMNLSVDDELKIGYDAAIAGISIGGASVPILMSNLPSGSTQPGGVVAGELWVDTDDQTIKMGV